MQKVQITTKSWTRCIQCGEYGYKREMQNNKGCSRPKYKVKSLQNSFKTQIYANLLLLLPFFQNYTIGNLQKHTNYIVTLAAKNLKGLGPNATIELRTEDGGRAKGEREKDERALHQTPLLSDALAPFFKGVFQQWCNQSKMGENRKKKNNIL